MPPLSPTRRWLALLALALGGFGIGATEFVAMGLLPDLARDLLPGLAAADPEQAIARSGWLISAYALGVVVGTAIINAVANVLDPKGGVTADPAQAVATLVSGLAQGVRSARLAAAE